MIKNKIHLFLHHNKYFLDFIYSLIILNVLSIILASYEEVRLHYGIILEAFEMFSVVIFTIEYILRIWSVDIYSGKKRYIFSKYGLIDLAAILPFYLPFIFPFDLRVIRILRLLRIFKLGRLSGSLKTITEVLKETKAELFVTIFIAFILLILSSSLMYFIEYEVQPEKFENIGQSLWWSVATLTTVGYGDVYPITGMGKFLSAIIALIGIGFVALPTGIISSAFIKRIQEEKLENSANKFICECPDCGLKFNRNTGSSHQ